LHIWMEDHQGGIVAYWEHTTKRFLTILPLSRALSATEDTVYTVRLGYER